MYREYPPDMRLSHLIETYWVADGVVGEPFAQKILPDGCVDIIFDFGGNNGIGKLPTELPKLVGTMTASLEVSYQIGRVQMMGIRFAPGGITAFVHIPVFEFTNQNTNLPLSKTLFDKSFYERLPDMSSMQERINYVNQYFIARLHKLYIPDERISHAISFIRKNNGQPTVKQIAEEVCLCERHFERTFKTAIGISPKIFSNITRFRFARQYMKAHKEESLFSVAISCGYHDQPHMNRDFRRFAGNSPSE